MRSIFLIVLLAAISSFQPAAKAEDAKLPTAREIIDRSIQEMGGRDAFLKHSSQTAKGKYNAGAQGISGTIELRAAKPNKLSLIVDLAAVGQIITVYDGTNAWSINPMTGAMLLEGKMFEQTAMQAEYDAMLHDDTKFKLMQTVGRTNFEGKECFAVKLVRKNGDESLEFYDVTNGLPRGTFATQSSPFGTLAVVSVMDDYKKMGEILFATKMVQKMSGLEQTMIFESVTFDDVPASTFDVPKEIKTMLGQKKSTNAPPAAIPSGAIPK